MGDWIGEHIRTTEWTTDKDGDGHGLTVTMIIVGMLLREISLQVVRMMLDRSGIYSNG